MEPKSKAGRLVVPTLAAAAALDGDGRLELLVGGVGGGLRYFTRPPR